MYKGIEDIKQAEYLEKKDVKNWKILAIRREGIIENGQIRC